MMTGTEFDIEKFDRKNDFWLWQVRMKTLLEQQGLAARGVTYSHNYHQGDDCNGDLEKLETLYMTKSLANRLYLKKNLYTFQMHPGKSQSEHIDEFHKLVGDLAAIDTAISDEDRALLLLASLSSSYDYFVETLLYGRDTLKLEDVLATLNFRELQKMAEAKGDGGEGLYSEEHLKRDCPSYNHKKSQGFVMNEDQVSASGAEGYDNADVMMAMSVEELLDWIMDSGGSYHITYMRDYLVDFEEYDGDNILLGDGRECHVCGTGKVQVQMRDWSSFVLDNVRNMCFNESGEYKKTFIGSGIGTGSMQVLQGVEFEDLIYYHPSCDREQHSAWELFSYREDSNKAAFVVATIEKIYAHESLNFNNTVAYEVISKWKAGLKDDMDSRSDVYVLNNGCRKCSDDNDIYYWEYTPGSELVHYSKGVTVQVLQQKVGTYFVGGTLFYCRCEGSLSGESCCENRLVLPLMVMYYAVGKPRQYQMVCTRLNIASADVGGMVAMVEVGGDAGGLGGGGGDLWLVEVYEERD
ncbi:hypothetical protein Tco_0959953 [Tanacetum coccineum]